MKKVLSALLSIALGCSFALGLVACGGDDKGSSNPKDMTGDKVTAEQWSAALSAESLSGGQVKAVQTESGKFTLPDSTTKVNGTNIETITYTIAGDKQYSKYEVSVSGDKAYVDAYNAFMAGRDNTQENYSSKVDDDIYIHYRKNSDGVWTFDVRNHGLFNGLEMMVHYGTMYDNFEYNSDKKGYTIKEDDPMAKDLAGTVLKFKKDKLSAVYSERTKQSDGETITMSVSYSITYGTYTVNLPAATSSLAGTWKTEEISYQGNALEAIPGSFLDSEQDVPVTADSVTITANNDGTATFKFLTATGKGAYEFYDDDDDLYGYFYSNDLPGAEEGDNDLYLTYDKDSKILSFRMMGLTVKLKKSA